jgi:hypothetical protein
MIIGPPLKFHGERGILRYLARRPFRKPIPDADCSQRLHLPVLSVPHECLKTP